MNTGMISIFDKGGIRTAADARGCRVRYGEGRTGEIMRFPNAHTSYRTVRHGWADDIRPNSGEVAFCYRGGGGEGFSYWIIGAPDAVHAVASGISGLSDRALRQLPYVLQD